MLLIASLCLVWPLARNRASAIVEADNSIDFFKEQIRQIDDEIARQKKPSSTLVSERAEIARRMLRENRRTTSSSKQKSHGKASVVSVSLAAILGVPVLSLALYASLGAAGQADYPLSARANLSLEDKPVEDLVQVAEKHLAKNPNDSKGWNLLADVYGRLNKPGDRARSLRQVIRIDGETPERLTDLGEALTLVGGNIVPAEARVMFQKAIAQKPEFVKPQIYMALALDQEGKPAEALKIWQRLATLNTKDERWQNLASSQIARLKQKSGLVASAPNIDDINAMVQGLAERLNEDDGTLDEWSRLIRSYMVLDEPVKASLALEKAKAQFQKQPETIKKLTELAKRLNVADVVRSQGASN